MQGYELKCFRVWISSRFGEILFLRIDLSIVRKMIKRQKGMGMVILLLLSFLYSSEPSKCKVQLEISEAQGYVSG